MSFACDAKLAINKSIAMSVFTGISPPSLVDMFSITAWLMDAGECHRIETEIVKEP